MTLAQVSLLFDAERRYHDPKAGRDADASEAGTTADLAMFASMKVG